MEALEAIKCRHSTRDFLDKPIPRLTLENIINAGRLAATACNDQPWDFLVITNPETRLKIANLVTFGRFIAQAPACVVVCCKPTWGYLEDGSAASQNMLIAAASLGVQSCWIGGDKAAYCSAVSTFLNLPPDRKLVSFIALGYESSPPRPRPKRDLSEVIHWEVW